jgi:hypothetical protein
LNPPSGSRTSTQRMGTANRPVLYHTAAWEAISTVRFPLPYQLAIVVGFQRVGYAGTTAGRRSRTFGFWRTVDDLGRRRRNRGTPNPTESALGLSRIERWAQPGGDYQRQYANPEHERGAQVRRRPPRIHAGCAACDGW